jgi:hypothetical protein
MSDDATDEEATWLIKDVAARLKELLLQMPLPAAVDVVIAVSAPAADTGLLVAFTTTDQTPRQRAYVLLQLVAGQVMTEVRAEDAIKAAADA